MAEYLIKEYGDVRSFSAAVREPPSGFEFLSSVIRTDAHGRIVYVATFSEKIRK